MKTVTVYHVDYVRRSRIPIGRVEERRKKDRGNNLTGLLRLARKTYGLGPEDAFRIAVDAKEALRQASIHQRMIYGEDCDPAQRVRPIARFRAGPSSDSGNGR